MHQNNGETEIGRRDSDSDILLDTIPTIHSALTLIHQVQISTPVSLGIIPEQELNRRDLFRDKPQQENQHAHDK